MYSFEFLEGEQQPESASSPAQEKAAFQTFSVANKPPLLHSEGWRGGGRDSHSSNNSAQNLILTKITARVKPDNGVWDNLLKTLRGAGGCSRPVLEHPHL